MIRSMTGFGDAAVQHDGVHYAVELRALNNRYFKASIRLPEELASLESMLEAKLRKKVTRGSLSLTISYKNPSAEAAYQINDAALKCYLSHLEKVEAETGDHGHVKIDLAALLSLPGIVQPPDQAELVKKAKGPIDSIVDQACEKMLEMRVLEGRGLVEDLAAHCKIIEQRLDTILERAPLVIEEYHQRLRARVDLLISRAALQVNEVDLVREIGVFAERSDISEEVQRIKAHLKQFDELIHKDDGEPVGRTLDFLSQELLREANTVASKSSDAQISRAIVEVKGSIDRIKEQVQNVE